MWECQMFHMLVFFLLNKPNWVILCADRTSFVIIILWNWNAFATVTSGTMYKWNKLMVDNWLKLKIFYSALNELQKRRKEWKMFSRDASPAVLQHYNTQSRIHHASTLLFAFINFLLTFVWVFDFGNSKPFDFDSAALKRF